MKQILFYTALFIFSAVAVCGQNDGINPPEYAELAQGETFEFKEHFNEMIGKINGKYYGRLFDYQRIGDHIHTIFVFDEKLNLVQQKVLELNIDGLSGRFTHALPGPDAIYLFANVANTDLGKKYLYLIKLDLNSLEKKEEPLRIAEFDFENRSDGYNTDFSIEISPDSTKLLVYYDTPYRKKENEAFGMHVFDRQMKELWHTDVVIPYTDKNFGRDRIVVTNNADVYVAGNLTKTKEELEKNMPDNKFVFVEVSDEGKRVSEYILETDDKYVESLMPFFNQQGELIWGGFYSDTDYYGARGSLFVTLNRETKKVEKKTFSPFTVDFITQDMSKLTYKIATYRIEKGQPVGISDLVLREIRDGQDGGTVFIGEQYVKVMTENDGVTQTKYYYEDIIIVNLDANGKIIWHSKIAKRQSAGSDKSEFSFSALAVGSHHYFIFNDNIDNLNRDAEQEVKFYSNSTHFICLAEVDTAGHVTRNVLLGKKNPAILPHTSLRTNNNEMIMLLEKGKNKNLSKLQIKK